MKLKRIIDKDCVQKIIDNLDIVSLTGIKSQGSHPIHGSTNGNNLSVDQSTNSWNCFRHQGGGGPLQWLAVEYFNVDCNNAKDYTRDNFHDMIEKASEITGIELEYEEMYNAYRINPAEYKRNIIPCSPDGIPMVPWKKGGYTTREYPGKVTTKGYAIICGSVNPLVKQVYHVLDIDFRKDTTDTVDKDEATDNIIRYLGYPIDGYRLSTKSDSRHCDYTLPYNETMQTVHIPSDKFSKSALEECPDLQYLKGIDFQLQDGLAYRGEFNKGSYDILKDDYLAVVKKSTVEKAIRSLTTDMIKSIHELLDEKKDYDFFYGDENTFPERYYWKDDKKLKRWVDEYKNDVAEWCISNFHIATNRKSNEMYVYSKKSAVWEIDDGYIKSVLTSIDLNKDKALNGTYIKEIVATVRSLTRIDDKYFSSSRYVSLGTKYFDMKKLKIVRPKLKYLCQTKLNVEYNPNATCPAFNKFMTEILPDDEVRQLVWEIMAYTLFEGYPLQHFFIFTGTGGNGKSIMFNALIEVLGEDNVSSIELYDFNNNPKRTLQLDGKLANICSDISEKDIKYSGYLKQITGDDKVNVEGKWIQAYSYKNYAKMIFAANKVPRFHDTTHGVLRRAIIVEFEQKFDQNIAKKLEFERKFKAETPGIFNELVKHAENLKERGHLPAQDYIKEKRSKFITDIINVDNNCCSDPKKHPIGAQFCPISGVEL